ncbi:MAG: DUF4349 domain-containing protein [Candidatus Eisenbacteria bacterium]|uniref:DUF4349 domain-containing protein n=1 Tax=Eiseniibacteriota bacterium TaxID=2212470 RepID=A0A849SQX0_UNCEI|nr:DUF4349 domain-containing protein [Candidatus Eisenbacteria bacterium]
MSVALPLPPRRGIVLSRRTLLPLVALLAALLLAAGCAGDRAAAPVAEEALSRSTAMDAVANQVMGGAASASPVSLAVGRRLIRSADLTLVVANLDSTRAEVERLAAAMQGFVAAANVGRQNGLPFGSLTLRVPVARLDALVAQLRGLALRVERESQSTQDVTDPFVELEAHLRTLRATEVELRNLLAESRGRGHKVADVMAIHRELTGIRTQIEQIQGQLQSLGQLAELATVQLALIPDPAIRPLAKESWRPFVTARASFGTLLAALRTLADLGIWAAVVLAPLALLIGLPLWLIVRGSRKRAPRVAGPAPTA